MDAGRRSGDGEVSRDEEFQWMFMSEYPAVARTVYLVVHDRGKAEEITQEAFMQLLGHWKRIRDYERPGAWVRRVAIRLAEREAHREGRRHQLERRAALAAPAADREMDLGPDPDLIDAIRTLPPKQRSVVVLFYLEDRPMDEVADIVGCSMSAGWVHLHQARKRLAGLLSEEASDDVR